MLIVVFTVLVTATAAFAAEMTVDFDGRTSGNQASGSSKSSLLDLINSAAFSEDNCGGLMACGTSLPSEILAAAIEAAGSMPLEARRNIPDYTLPQVPAPDFPMPTPIPSYLSGGCAMYCPYGYTYGSVTGGCSCKPDPWYTIWEQEGGVGGFNCEETNPNSWVGMALCYPGANAVQGEAGRKVKSKKTPAAAQPALQKQLLGILLAYCDTYPEFAAAVLPMLKDGKAKIGVYDGFVHIVNSKKIIRFAGKAAAEAEQKNSPRKSGPGFQSTAAQAADAIINAITAWN